jgi:hypothetical protein
MNNKTPKKPGAAGRLIATAALALGALCPPQAQAQVPARFYWKTLSDANAVPLIFNRSAATRTRSTPRPIR